MAPKATAGKGKGKKAASSSGEVAALPIISVLLSFALISSHGDFVLDNTQFGTDQPRFPMLENLPIFQIRSREVREKSKRQELVRRSKRVILRKPRGEVQIVIAHPAERVITKAKPASKDDVPFVHRHVRSNPEPSVSAEDDPLAQAKVAFILGAGAEAEATTVVTTRSTPSMETQVLDLMIVTVSPNAAAVNFPSWLQSWLNFEQY
ncbi:uncharacterized protein A4U43_C10F15080 [Asparagus officinalis]|uniref:Uncharacterized protein n=1 Tax=Asparagus officinalis TaxID=4686 RepID=A0A5P1E646_ASPOF|nr:uncharacterized protein A4U43_C10F15080 [Asparagus officinalis]